MYFQAGGRLFDTLKTFSSMQSFMRSLSSLCNSQKHGLKSLERQNERLKRRLEELEKLPPQAQLVANHAIPPPSPLHGDPYVSTETASNVRRAMQTLRDTTLGFRETMATEFASMHILLSKVGNNK